MCAIVFYILNNKYYTANILADGIIRILNEHLLSNIFQEIKMSKIWNGQNNPYNKICCDLMLIIRRAIIETKIPILKRDGDWLYYVELQMVYHIYQELIHFYDIDYNHEFHILPIIYNQRNISLILKKMTSRSNDIVKKFRNQFTIIDNNNITFLEQKLLSMMDKIITSIDFVNILRVVDNEYMNRQNIISD